MSVARIAPPSRPTVKPATGIRLLKNVVTRRLRASRPPPRRSSIALSVVAVAATLGAIFFDHLVHAHAARDHGVHVRLRVYVEVQDGEPRLLLSPTDRRLDVVALPDGPAAQAVRSGELFVVGTGDGRLGVAAVVEELLPLAHHAEVAVVEDGYLDVEAEVPYGGELLEVHLDAAVAGHDPHRLVRVGQSDPHRRWQGEAHRAEAPRRDVAVLLGELEELGRPHLVLSDVGDEPDLFAGGGLYGVHDPDRAVLAPGLVLAPLLRFLISGDLRPPPRAAVRPFILEVDEDAAQGTPRVRGDSDGRLDDLGVRGELVHGARDPVVEPHPDREE